MLAKLEHYGIQNSPNLWFKSYLSKRKQYVSYDDQNSSLLSFSCGVPQGSILGPFLFILYINDLVNSSKVFKFVIFADDSNLYISHANIKTLIELANRELLNIRSWITLNKLTLNVKKSHYIIFHRKKLPSVLNPVLLGSEPLQRVQSTKFLGVTIEDTLKWDKHIKNIANKVNKLSGILYQTRDMLTSSALKTIYHSLIYPNLTYCHVVWGTAGPSKVKQVTNAQKRAIRTISYLKKFDPTNDAFSRLGILKFSEITTYCSAMYVYKSINGFVQNNYFTSRTNNRYQLRHPNNLTIPRVRSSQSQKFISFHGSKIWNNLPPDLKGKPISSFKSSLKAHLLAQYCNT